MKKQRTPTQKTIGHHLKIARKQQKMSVQELARKVNMKATYIEAIESDEITEVASDLLYRIGNALGKTPAELMGRRLKKQEGYL